MITSQSSLLLSGFRFSVILFFMLAMPPFVAAQQTYKLDLTQEPKPVLRGHLDLGGTAPGGASIAVNNFYIEKNGKGFVPVVGEFHYCRYPSEYWEESLRKMKAGGVNVVATYVFWNMHERTEGHFDWSGDLDLRRFVELAGKVGLSVIVRLGPFAHGEIRNGGLPDWLYGRPFEVRSNDPEYLAYTDKLYAAIAGQLKGLLYKEGGPIIGVQLDNEFQHSAAPWEFTYPGAPIEPTVAERDLEVTHEGVSVSAVTNKNAGYGSDHMANLKLIARRNGLDVPLYTATGWGNAAIVPKCSLPVTAAYPYPFWTPRPTPSPFYLFKDIRGNPDYAPASYDKELYPSIPAELGAGIAPKYARRPYVLEESVEPLIVRVLGSGSNGIGYYMYHSGSTPSFDNRYYSEEASGLPKIGYDYQSPIGSYGQTRSHFHSLNLLHLFLRSFGERLAPMQSILPTGNERIISSDTTTLRYAARAVKGSGFLFMLNFQDHAQNQDLEHLRLKISDGRREIPIPSAGEFTLMRGACAILPVNLDVDGTPLRSATVQALAILTRGKVRHHLFFSIEGLAPELVFDGGVVSQIENCRVSSAGGAVIVSGQAGQSFSFSVDGRPVLVIPRKLALQAAQTEDGRMLFADATVLENGPEMTLLSSGRTSFDVTIYPAIDTLPKLVGAAVEPSKAPLSVMSAFRVSFAPVKYSASVRKVAARKYAVHFEQGLGSLNDVIMRVNYVGDTAMAFIDSQMIDDHFYYGRPWEIGLKHFLGKLQGKEMVLVFHPMARDASCLIDIPEEFRPKFKDGETSFLKVGDFEFIPEYKASFVLP